MAQSVVAAQPLAASEHDLLVGIAPAAVGIIVVLLLIGAVIYGRWRRAREPGPPNPDEHPKGPAHTDGYEEGFRDPAEIPRTDRKGRLTPQQVNELGAAGTKEGDPDSDRGGPWQEGHSGSFGSG